MAEFIFNCPFCKKEIGADTAWIGRSSECPHCLSMIVVRQNPVPEIKKEQKTIKQPKLEAKKQVITDEQTQETDKCPYCHSQINKGATTCPHCTHSFYSTNPGVNFVYWIAGIIVTLLLIHVFASCETQRITNEVKYIMNR